MQNTSLLRLAGCLRIAANVCAWLAGTVFVAANVQITTNVRSRYAVQIKNVKPYLRQTLCKAKNGLF
jgi:hypothetical protein